jgi:hypothetical protein
MTGYDTSWEKEQKGFSRIWNNVGNGPANFNHLFSFLKRCEPNFDEKFADEIFREIATVQMEDVVQYVFREVEGSDAPALARAGRNTVMKAVTQRMPELETDEGKMLDTLSGVLSIAQDSVTVKQDKTLLLMISSLLQALTYVTDHQPERDEVIERLRFEFESHDLDGNGSLSLEELKGALRVDASRASMFGLARLFDPEDEASVQEIFIKADEDGTGTICWNEFVELMRQLQALRARHKFEAVAGRRAFTVSASGHRMSSVSGVQLMGWYIDYWDLKPTDELSLVMQALTAFDCLEELHADAADMTAFAKKIKETYRGENPYHNFQHAMSTLHYAFKLLDAAGIAQTAAKTTLFALAIGALCHDCDHRGYNNAFEVVTMSELAIRYNDKSPLENHHSAIAFQAARGEGDIFKKMKKDSFRTIRQLMVAGILGTDMAYHGDGVKRLHHISKPEALNDDSEFLVVLFMHTADIANPMMPSEIKDMWCERIDLEFTAQVDMEKKLGLPVTAFMDGLTDQLQSAKTFLGFIDFVITPLVTPLFKLYPNIDLPKSNLEANRKATTEKISGSA